MSIRGRINKRLKSLERPFEVFNEISVSRSSVLKNFDRLTSLSPGHVIPVLKSNAYGHGLVEVARILAARTFPYIAVDGFYEALAIREVSKQPVLVMGAIEPANFGRMNFNGFAFVVHDIETVQALGATGRPVTVHIEIDTGMTRHGVARDGLPAFLDELKKHQNIRLEGLMTHLADADNPAGGAYNELQTTAFDRASAFVMEAGFAPKYFHIAQSAGSTKIVSRYANAVRAGDALYGINPLDPVDGMYGRLDDLSPALSLTSIITKVQDAKAGTAVGYNGSFRAARPTRIGVLPLGYYEGVPFALSNAGQVQLGEVYLPVAGRISMNHTTIDLGDSAAGVGDAVMVISRDKTSKVSAEAICRQHGVPVDVLLAGLNQNIRRRVVA